MSTMPLRALGDDLLAGLLCGTPPAWVEAWGEDDFGVFADFGVADTTQRLRWIPGGVFRMGSPPDEPGRVAREGPVRAHAQAGFWIFDAPCTQALWQAVMGDNPSRFRTRDRPVERVSYLSVETFIARINASLVGLTLALPSSEEWEHACRAGTNTALYNGPIEIRGARNAPALDAIAWYGGNSGVDYDLDEGEDLGKWPERQYQAALGGTHPVKRRLPNAWGLYDMLGNVWEWTQTPRAVERSHRSTDKTRRRLVETTPVYIIRGGAWHEEARFCRAAYSYWRSADRRDYGLGFRCVRRQGA